MIEIVPDYYDQFKCIAENCPDTCCAGWEIVIDPDSLKKYKKYHKVCRNPFANRLRNEVDFENSCFLQFDKRCAFLNEYNLCDLYNEAGKGMLCKTCKVYPRHIEEFEDVREISLSLSCPEVARIILTNKERVQLITNKKKGDEEFDDFDNFLYSMLEDAREVMIRKCQERMTDASVRLCYVLALSHDIQRRINQRRLFETEALLEKVIQYDVEDQAEEKIKSYRKIENKKVKFDLMSQMFDVLWKMEYLRSDWEATLEECKKVLYTDFESYCKLDAYNLENIYIEQLMVYFLYTYYCGAVYDENQYNKVKFGIVMILFIQEMTKAFAFKENGLSVHQIIEVSYKLSREIEHSDLNLNKMERIVTKSSLFSMENLFICLLN